MSAKQHLYGQVPNTEAWEYDYDWLRSVSRFGRHDPTVSAWIVKAPWAHMCWHSYMIVAFHLRQLPDCPPAEIMLHGATHEIHVDAIDPEWKFTMEQLPIGARLEPSNFIAQW